MRRPPAALLLAALTGTLVATLLTAPGVAIATPTPTAPAVIDAARGTITWGECPAEGFDGFECGVLTVPLDWDNLANPANAEIALTVKRASGKSRGYLSFNPGGPGESGMASAPAIWGEMPRQVQQRFDWVGWDPRGVGLSQPQLTGCLEVDTEAQNRATPYEPPATGPVDWTAFTETYVAAFGAGLTECLALNQDVAPYLGTYYVIRDLEAMRVALGAPKWNFWGMSYGTRIGYRYAREYPDRVRTLILDGSWSPNLTVTTWMGGSTWSWATVQQVFASLFGKEMGARLQRVIEGLDKRTISVEGTELTRWQVLPAIFTNISYQAAYPDIVDVITEVDEALEGNEPGAILQPLRSLQRRAAEDQSAQLNIYFINCRDMAGYPSVEQIARAASTATDNQSVYAGLAAMQKGAACAGLPADFTYGYEPLNRPLELPTAPIVINSLGDTRTEYVFGRNMSTFMAGSSLITYDGTQHVTYLQTPSRCVNDAVTRYLIHRTQPGPLLCPYSPLPAAD